MQRSKTAPKGAAIFVADCLARDGYLLTNHNAADTIADLLGFDGAQSVTKVGATLSAGGDARAQVITLALVLGALEARLCGVARSVHCSVVLPSLGGSLSGTALLLAALPANSWAAPVRPVRPTRMSRWVHKGFGGCSDR